MSDTVKVCWSGGKDSTASVLLHLDRGDHCNVVNYIPYLKDEIPLIRKNHFEFIQNTAERFRQMGCEVYMVRGISYYEHTHRLVKRGGRKGTPYGTGLGIGYCKFRDYSKIETMDKLDVGAYDYDDIGIAYDEPKRQNQLTDKLRSILVEEKWTEQLARMYCIQHDMLSPHYDNHGRDGCAICPNAKAGELDEYFNDYPEAIDIMIEIEELCKMWTPTNCPMRGHQWWSDTSVKMKERLNER